ncbi:MAG: ribulokinase [Actinomycetota bacterium]
MAEQYTIGVDYGTLSGRAVVVRVSDGAELGTGVFEYPNAVMDEVLNATGQKLGADWALQDPNDYVEVLRNAVPEAIRKAGIDPADVIGIGTDFTACTMVPTLSDGTPLSNLPEFRGNPHAYVKLWKHHAAQPHADRINQLARERNESWLPRYGGQISSEWELAKGLQVFEEAPEVYHRMERWVEAADWIIWQLCGNYVRNACTAGYKGNLQDGEYPSSDYFEALSPGFGSFIDEKVRHPIGQLGDAAGLLTEEAASWTGLKPGIVVAVGNVDAHVTAPAAQATEPGQMVAIMGTSTCHVMNGQFLTEVPGMCGVVDGGIVSGLYGYEAGQSGVGDIFAWYVNNQVPGEYFEAAAAAGKSIHQHLTDLAAEEGVGEHGLVALDWHSGNRSVLVDHELSGLVIGSTLTTKPEQIYRALLEATAFGTRKIVETFQRSGVPVTEFIVAGGLLKNKFLMQLYSDATRLPLSTIASEQGPALGSAIHAAVAAGAYPDIRRAAAAMGKADRGVYQPNEARARQYDLLYAEYDRLHDYFGRGENNVMKRLKAIRRGDSALPADRIADSGVVSAGAVFAGAGSRSQLIAAAQKRVADLHQELVRYGLVVWTGGNVSERIRFEDGSPDLFAIKPSGVSYEQLKPEDIVICDLDGNLIEGSRKPSSDTDSHAYVYRNMPEVNGVVHTHSDYAAAWAARGEEIPCVLTAMADEFGGPIPVGPFAIIGDDSIGRGIVQTLKGHRSTAVLMQNHGVFTIGDSAKSAVKSAVMCEDVARTVHLTLQHGPAIPIPQDKIDSLYARYQNVYGQ